MIKISRLVLDNQDEEAADPFAEYVWMCEMEKVDREIEAEIEKEFEEEDFITSCIEQLLEEEDERETVYFQTPGGVSNELESTKRTEVQKIPDVQNIINLNGLDPNLTQNISNVYISQQIPLPPQLPRPRYQNGEVICENGPLLYPQHHVYTGNTDPLPPPYRQVPPWNNIQHAQDEPRLQKPGDVKKVPRVNGYTSVETRGRQYYSTLNPNALPFVMNPKAKEFVPQCGNNGAGLQFLWRR